MEFMRKGTIQCKIAVASLIFLAFFAPGLCGGGLVGIAWASDMAPGDASATQIDAQKRQDMDCSAAAATAHSAPQQHHNLGGDTAANCCANDTHHTVFDKVAGAPTDGETVLVACLAIAGNPLASFSDSGRTVINTALHPPQGAALSSVIKKE